MKRFILLLPAIFMAMACNKTVMSEDIPALIVEPDTTSRNELKHTVASALKVTDVTLAEDALTTDSLLIIERKQHHSLERSPAMGRDLGRPEMFRLVISTDQCVLVHQRDGQRWVLENTRCAPVTK